MNIMKNNTSRLLLLACLSMPLLAACQNDGADAEAETTAEAAPLAAPAGTDTNEWNAYLTDVVTRNMGAATSTYVYTLPAEDSEDFEGSYERQLEKATGDVSRGVNAGTLLAFGSSSPTRSADMTVAAFSEAVPNTLEGVRVLFIGDAADSARVEAAVAPSGAEYQFIEAN